MTPTAKSLLFFADSEKKLGVIRLLASDDSTAQKINSRAMLPPLTPIGSGAWESKILLLGDEKSSEQMFVTMGLFGFGLYL